MKTLCLLFALLSVNIASAQDTAGTRDYYLAKSTHQKKIGTILIMSGAVMILVAGAIGTQDQSESSFGLPPHFGEKLLLGGAGVVVGLSGVPFMISGARHARKAASIGISNQTILLPSGNTFVARRQPSVSLKITLP
jgi:hypothetical protein